MKEKTVCLYEMYESQQRVDRMDYLIRITDKTTIK